MNEELIRDWNAVVKEGDTVYHLGDFVWGGITRWREILDQLNGDIILIKGNHDDSKVIKKLYKEGYFKELHEVGLYRKVKYEGIKYQMWLSHYPMEIGERERKFSISGHIHEEKNTWINQINVGVDSPLLAKNRDSGYGYLIDEEGLLAHMQRINNSMKLRKEGK